MKQMDSRNDDYLDVRVDRKGIQDHTQQAWANPRRVVPFIYTGITGERTGLWKEEDGLMTLQVELVHLCFLAQTEWIDDSKLPK